MTDHKVVSAEIVGGEVVRMSTSTDVRVWRDAFSVASEQGEVRLVRRTASLGSSYEGGVTLRFSPTEARFIAARLLEEALLAERAADGVGG